MSPKRSRSPSSSLSPPPAAAAVASPPAAPAPASAAPVEGSPAKGSRATKKARKEEVPDLESLPTRSTSKLRIGAHVSAAGGVHHSCLNAATIGATSFALFVKSQRKWTAPPLDAAAPGLFENACKELSYNASKDILPHGSYLVNLANPDPAKREKSFDCFLDDLKRCEAFGIGLYNFHPGSAMKEDRAKAIGYVADAVNRAHKETSSITIVLENMAGQGDVLGSHFEDLSGIIGLVDDKERVGVCIDTCHLFAASVDNDIRTPEAVDRTLTAFFEVVPARYLKALHVNDSKFELGAKKDRHENLGLGAIGLTGFHSLLHWPGPPGARAASGAWAGWEDVIWVLETPSSENGTVWRREIEILHQLETLQDPAEIPAIEAAWKTECALLRSGGKGKKPKATKAKTSEPHDDDDDDDSSGKAVKKSRKTSKAGPSKKKAPARKKKADISSESDLSDA